MNFSMWEKGVFIAFQHSCHSERAGYLSGRLADIPLFFYFHDVFIRVLGACWMEKSHFGAGVSLQAQTSFSIIQSFWNH